MEQRSTQRVTKETVTLRFEGDSVEDGTISARAMAVALGGVADLVQALGSIGEYQEHPTPEARVVATEEGSFLLELDIVALGEWWASAREALVGDDLTALVNLGSFVTMAGGAIALLKKIGQSKVKAVEPTSDGMVEVKTDDGVVEVVTPEVAQAVTAPRVQAAAKRVVEPLTFTGIQQLTINADTVNVVVSSAEAAKLPEPAAEEDPARKVEFFDAWATFNRPDFGGTKWGVTTTRASFQAIIEDQEFLARVDDGSVSLNKYAEFRITVRMDPYITKGGQRRFHRAVTKVHEQRGGNGHQAEGLPDESGEGEI